MEKDIIEMSQKELKRVGVIQRVGEKKLKQREGGEMLGISARQVRRLVTRYREQGEEGLRHGLRGRRSNRSHPEKLRKMALGIYRGEYGDFGPTLAWEKLTEKHKIRIGMQTLRRWLLEEGLWEIVPKSMKHRQWRERKSSYGQMIQMDGSHHDWLEGRGPALVLMGYIDDATGRVFGQFHDYEGTLPAMESFYGYARRCGLPQSLYTDRLKAYRGHKPLSLQEELMGHRKTKSQFERALEELGVEVIHAQSPQAKGRIERLFKTFQDRLIKEMRLAQLTTKDRANQFLRHYLPGYNRRFSVQAREALDLHRQAPNSRSLREILSIQTFRFLRQDNTVRHNGKLYQILSPWKASRPKQIMVREHFDGRFELVHERRSLNYRILLEPMRSVRKPSHYLPEPPAPTMDHPFKRQSFQRYLQRQQQRQNRTFLSVAKEDISNGG